MNIYGGYIDANGNAVVCKNGEDLSPERSLKARRHSPTGFHWGYGGSGPAQLALALLLEEVFYGRAMALYQAFKCEVISKLDNTPLTIWRITSDEIREWVKKKVDTLQEQEWARN